MGLMGLAVSLLVKVVITVLVVAALITIIPGIPPDIKFEAYSVVPPVNLNEFEENYALDKALIHYNEVSGPESIATRGDDIIFTGDSQGNLIKILANGDHSVVVKFQHSCGKWNILVDLKTPIEGIRPRSPNDVDIARDGTVFWSHVSRHSDKFGYILHEVYGEPSGRLIKYDPNLKTNTVLLDHIHFANGVCLSGDEDFVIVSEIVQARILRYYLKGPKKGTHDVFVDGLPGAPDNIRPNGKGGFYVGLCVPWNDEFSLFDVERLGNLPYLRKLLLRSRFLLLSLLDGIKTLFGNNSPIQIIEPYLQHGNMWSNLPKVGLVMELDKQGSILNVLRSKQGEVYSVSELTLGMKYAYMASPFNTKVWKVKLQDLPGQG